MTQDEMNEVWNRAAMQNGGSTPRAGDAALAALLLAHGMVMNGGVFHAAVDALDAQEMRAACDGFRYFGFEDVADLLELASKTEWTRANEETFNARYWHTIPKDAVLVERFERHFVGHRDQYAAIH